jgi:hypothetical protein
MRHLYIFTLPMLVACSGVHFNSVPVNAAASLPGGNSPGSGSTLPSQNITPSPGPSCVPQQVGNITRLTKIIFVVDTSGSNAYPSRDEGTIECLPTDPDYASCTPPTDPKKAFRGGAIQNFLNTYGAKTNFEWGFITFSGTQAHALINSNGNDQVPYLSSNPTDLQNAINQFYAIQDYDATPYQAAIHMVETAVSTDRDLNTINDPQYFMIMLTDGFPTDYVVNGQFSFAALEVDILALLGIGTKQVSLSTIYYGTVNDPNAESLLQNMASQGHGQYASVNDVNSGIKIDDVIPGGTTCQ